MARESCRDNDNPLVSAEFGPVGLDSLLNWPVLLSIVMCRNKFLSDSCLSPHIHHNVQLNLCILIHI